MPQTMAGVEEIFCYTTHGNLDHVVEELGINLIADVGDSTATFSTMCVLPDDHPAIRLYERRRTSGISSMGWPWGLAALDALDHRDARVRQAAEDAWNEWITNQDIEAMKHRTRNG